MREIYIYIYIYIHTCGAKESVAPAQAQFILRSAAQAEDDFLLGTSLNAQRKEQAEYSGQGQEKAANTVMRNSASDRPMPMPMRLSNNSQPL